MYKIRWEEESWNLELKDGKMIRDRLTAQASQWVSRFERKPKNFRPKADARKRHLFMILDGTHSRENRSYDRISSRSLTSAKMFRLKTHRKIANKFLQIQLYGVERSEKLNKFSRLRGKIRQCFFT